jgi:endonuclease/exonuclease/phosphatase (EEP) superfamily protein YafD
VTDDHLEAGVIRPRGRVRRFVARPALAGVMVIAALEWGLILFRPEHGLLAILQVLAPHLALLALVLIPISLLEVRRISVVTAVLLGLVVSLRFGGDWVSLPVASASGARNLEVVTWNLEVDSRPGVNSVALIRGQEADLIALQELQPDTAAAIEADPMLVARYPYRVLVPRHDVLGQGLLSRLPVLDSSFAIGPAVQEALLDLGGGRTLAVVNAHPYHADIEFLGTTNLPVGLDARIRNDDLDRIRGRVDARIGQGLPVVLLGDLNTAASEPAFDRFVDGLRELHREVGLGTGWTWRPSRLEFLGIGLVRIDHVVVSPDITPLSISGTCPPVGDHCIVDALIGVPNGGG